MDPLNIGLLCIGLLVLVLGLLSERLKRSLLSAPMLALAVGILLGPEVTGLLEISKWGNEQTILEQAARLTLAISLMGIALRLPRRYPLTQWRPLAVLLGPLMVLMWLVSGIPFARAALLGGNAGWGRNHADGPGGREQRRYRRRGRKEPAGPSATLAIRGVRGQ